MGFLDKAKEAAEKAMASAQQAAQQGQAKVGSYQQGRSEKELYSTLGEAFYREQRSGGDRQAVQAALDALDAHVAAAAAAAQAAADQAAAHAAGQAAAPGAAAWPAAPAPGAPTPPPPSAGPPGGAPAASGNFTLDDL
jgi:hypothetical protein